MPVRLNVTFWMVSETPTGVYYSITQCRLGRASPNRPADVGRVEFSICYRRKKKWKRDDPTTSASTGPRRQHPCVRLCARSHSRLTPDTPAANPPGDRAYGPLRAFPTTARSRSRVFDFPASVFPESFAREHPSQPLCLGHWVRVWLAALSSKSALGCRFPPKRKVGARNYPDDGRPENKHTPRLCYLSPAMRCFSGAI